MRILMLAQSYAPIIGGEERVVEDLSTELVRRGHEVAVATLPLPDGGEHETGNGVRVHTLRSSTHRLPGVNPDIERLHAPPVPDPETVLDLRRVMRQERPEIVHAHNWLVHSYLPLNRGSDAALVLSLHDYGLLCATKRLMYRDRTPCSGPALLKCVGCSAGHYGGARGAAIALATRMRERSLRGHVDLFLPISAAVSDLCRLGPGDSYRIVPNFIGDLPAPPPADDPRLDRLPDEPYVLYFGDVREDKGADVLIDAYAELSDAPPLVLIGRWLLGRQVDSPRLVPLGPWPHALAIEAVRRCMFTVAPSVWPEPFGLVALETAAAGKPIVASDIGGLPDIVADGETGLLVPPGDRSALRAALQRLIGDPDLRSRMGEAGAHRTALFAPELVVPQFEECYGSATAARRSRRANR
jgi:glycosyltransferase involved in cell wall biosynthesis